MVIRTSDKEYPVIGVQNTNEQFDIYICRNVGGKGFYRILSVKDGSKFPEIVSFLNDSVSRDAFTDYDGYFIDDGKLCIVMRYTQGIALGTKLATESVPFKERLELGRKILEKAVLQEIPDYFLAKCFTPEQIVVESDLSVSFNYPIEDIITNRQQKCRGNIEQVLRLLFDKELERKVPQLLMDFFKSLPELCNQRLLDIYSEYYALMGQLEEYDAEADQPKTFWFRLWSKIKKVLKVLKKVLIILLVLASIAYLIYTILDPGKDKGSDGHFKAIGTVEIQTTEATKPTKATNATKATEATEATGATE